MVRRTTRHDWGELISPNISIVDLHGAAAATGAALPDGYRPALLPSRAPTNASASASWGPAGAARGSPTPSRIRPTWDVTYVCDVDQARADRAATAVPRPPAKRRRGPSRTSNASSMTRRGTCSSSPPAITGTPRRHPCMRGRQAFYVEKPCSYNPREGELSFSGRKHQKKVQMAIHAAAIPRFACIDESTGRHRRVCLAQSGTTISSTSAEARKGPFQGLDYDSGRPRAAPAVPLELSPIKTGTGSGTGQRASWATTASHDRPVRWASR